MIVRGRFHFRPALTIVTVLAFVILVSLGSWQLHRLGWKQDLIAKTESRVSAAPIAFEDAVRRASAGEDMEYVPVRLSGEFSVRDVIKLFGADEGDAGAFYFRQFKTSTGAIVYVNDGFVSQRVPTESISLSSGLEEVVGLLRYPETPTPPASWFRSKTAVGGLWFVRDPSLFSANTPSQNVLRFYVDRSAVEGRQWPQGGKTRLDFNNRHLEYALTWFGLALTLIGVWVAFSLKK